MLCLRSVATFRLMFVLKESEAIGLYNEALRHRHLGNLQLARQTLIRLLKLPFIEKVVNVIILVVE